MKNSFILYTDYMKHLDLLNMEQRGILLTALMLYQQGEPLPDMEPITQMAFSFIRQDIDANNIKWEETRQKRSEAGKKGGRPKANESKGKQEKAKKANGFSEKQEKAKKAVNVNVNVNDNVNVNSKKENIKRKRKQSVPESRIGKNQFGDEVYLTMDEYTKLISQYGKEGAKRIIEILDNYKVSKGATYLSDYRAILNWVVKRYEEENQKSVKPQNNNPWVNGTASEDQDDLYLRMIGVK